MRGGRGVSGTRGSRFDSGSETRSNGSTLGTWLRSEHAGTWYPFVRGKEQNVCCRFQYYRQEVTNLISPLRCSLLFRVRDQGDEARIAVKRIEHGVCFDTQVNPGRQPVVNCLTQK